MHSHLRCGWAGLSAALLILVAVPSTLLAQVPPPVVTPPPQTRTAAQAAATGAGYDVSNAGIALFCLGDNVLFRDMVDHHLGRAPIVTKPVRK